MINIAIDGPSGAGKSTISRRLANDLGFRYVDTGAIYRAIGLSSLRGELNLSSVNVDVVYENSEQHVFLNGEDVSSDIRDHAVSKAASDVSARSDVRAFLLETQRRIAREYDVVMDGRDIGTVVLPNADVKIFLTATSQERARRRYEELCARGDDSHTLEEILTDIQKRDYNDSNRSIAPLKRAPDAIVVDTTGNAWEKSVTVLRSIIDSKLLRQQRNSECKE
jgi:cytidylate kinase